MRLLSVLALLALLVPAAAAGRELVDLAGRKVTVPDRVERVIIGEGRYLPALAILDRADPVARLVGMMGEYEAVDPVSYARYRERFPALDRVKRIGRVARDSFSLEQAIAASPQVAIFGIGGHGPDTRSGEVIRALEAAGVAIIFIDFRSDPLVNTPRSMELLGTLLGREAEAAEFVAAWRAALAVVTDRLAAARPTPARVFVESRVGLGNGCCETMTRGMMGRFVTAAGGVNIADALIPGEAGVVSLEWLVANPPEVYIGTAIGSGVQRDEAPWLALGPGVDVTTARERLARSMTRNGIAGLDAVRQGRAHAVWHHFYNSPFNVAAVQVFAQWLHPQLFADLDPQALLATMQRRFQPVPLDGTYWTSLR
ncbi:MAG TPA: ABC transporter substrate-binding protein [Bosea sp. (in: a-proteobacteria)]|jgi:iron complex transport system substrate-binding protein|uniref:ABC transporter substrate-binding protein n=1 Tax=Bosea sp. (in: a-proteobacteria) TaxID=1871050 RepID=UPI002E14B6D7|nr:ABC transporter substrate-binding protein [Bosea sp. (in: a-proteobacteria)]